MLEKHTPTLVLATNTGGGYHYSHLQLRKGLEKLTGPWGHVVSKGWARKRRALGQVTALNPRAFLTSEEPHPTINHHPLPTTSLLLSKEGGFS